MPFFKTTKNILKNPWEDEFFDENFMDTKNVYLPIKIKWNYKRELQIEDVDLWEVIYEESGGVGIYASWNPYAEFYMVTTGFNSFGDKIIETYYGRGSQYRVQKKIKELKLPIYPNKIWVDKEDMWLYT